jgi:hypothetical protein
LPLCMLLLGWRLLWRLVCSLCDPATAQLSVDGWGKRLDYKGSYTPPQ